MCLLENFLKKINLDYNHGTGHGVGYFLNVHEGPHAISKKTILILKKEWLSRMNQDITKKISSE